MPTLASSSMRPVVSAHPHHRAQLLAGESCQAVSANPDMDAQLLAGKRGQCGRWCVRTHTTGLNCWLGKRGQAVSANPHHRA